MAEDGATRRARRVAGAIAVIVASACTAHVPPRADAREAVELTAASHLLALHPSTVIAIDSGYARADQAPGHPRGAYRPADRTAALAAALQARVGSSVPDGGVHLILSEPEVAGDSARVTVTANWKGGGGWRAGRSGYHTQALVLVRDGASWRVVRVVELGIT